MENKKNKIEDEDIKLWHKIFYNKVCSQIKAKEAEISVHNAEKEEYENFKSAVADLNKDVDSCVLDLNRTYTYASSGVSCADFNSGIEEIGTYGENMGGISESLNAVIESINDKIAKLEEKISDVYAEIGRLKSSIGI